MFEDGYFAEATVSTKGHLVMPKSAQTMMKIKEGDSVLFFTEDKFMALDTKNADVLYLVIKHKQEGTKKKNV